jgi:hypothetical protein
MVKGSYWGPNPSYDGDDQCDNCFRVVSTRNIHGDEPDRKPLFFCKTCREENGGES